MLSRKSLSVSIQILLLLFVIAACSPVRKLEPNQRFIKKVKVVETEKINYPVDDLKDYVYFKTNKKILGVWRFNLQMYLMVNQKKMQERRKMLDEKRKKKNQALIAKGKKPNIKERSTFGEKLIKIGEPPTLLDTSLIEKSTENIASYLMTKGYFDAKVRDTILLLGKKRAAVGFFVQPNQPYIIHSLTYDVSNKYMAEVIKESEKNSLIKVGKNFDLDLLNKERGRITKLLREKSFFYFNKDFVVFEADSSIGKHQVDLRMVIHDPNFNVLLNKDTVKINKHRSCKINKVVVETNYSITNKNVEYTDTIIYKGYYFPYNSIINYKPSILEKSIVLEAGNVFNSDDHEKTYNYLSSLRNFRFVNIEYDYAGRVDGYDMLDCKIQLTPAQHQSLGADAQGTTTGSYPGIEGSFTYTNRNAFYGAEIFEFKVFAKAESQVVDQSLSQGRAFFNTLEFGGDMSIKTPVFLLPFNIGKFSKRNRPQSAVRLGLSFQDRPDYQRLLTYVNFGYEWNENAQKRHIFNPLEISLIRVFKSQAFEAFLQQTNDKFTQNIFSTHIIVNNSHTYSFSNYQMNKVGNFQSLRTNIQFGGNMIYLGSLVTKAQKDELGRYRIADVPYAQYARAEVDFRNYYCVNKSNTFATRALFGLGLPYGNSFVMPFEKSFSAGGANDIRGWIARRIGPGAYNPANGIRTVDQFADIKLLLSLEYRLKVIKQIEIALFADAGNVWLLRNDNDRPQGNFDFKRFYKELALSVGFGLRLNLGYFVFRLDPSVPLYDPTQNTGEKWVVDKLTLKKIIWNLAIGFPF